MFGLYFYIKVENKGWDKKENDILFTKPYVTSGGGENVTTQILTMVTQQMSL